MKIILILGAGRSSLYLIEYLLGHAAVLDAKIVVADTDITTARQKIGNHPSGEAIQINTADAGSLALLVEKSHFVVSMLPAHLHVEVAKKCIGYRVNMATASYAIPEMRALHNKAVENGVTIMMECGLDPGIDHLSALKMIHEIKEKGGIPVSFRSYCGGLPAPESDDNPLHYKISWAPRNVVLAGQGGDSVYRLNGETIRIPYVQLFQHAAQVAIPGWETLEAYPNRDSMLYEQIYGLEGIPTLLRGTLRYKGFCDAWQQLVELGYTNEQQDINTLHPRTFLALTQKLMYGKSVSLHESLVWLGLDKPEEMPTYLQSPAQVVQYLLESKLMLKADDKDLVVMHHELTFSKQGQLHGVGATLIQKGENAQRTAMAKTVGLPLAMVVKRMVSGEHYGLGVQLPVHPRLYLPVLHELESQGIRFEEHHY